MVIAATADLDTAGGRLLAELLRAKGLEPGSYALFFVVGEGTFFEHPETQERVEAASGSVLDAGGRVFSFWMEWDPELGRPTLSEWEQVDPEPSWAEVPEYQRARRRLHLPAA